MDAVPFLDAVSGYARRTYSNGSADRPIRLAKIDEVYNALGAGTYPGAPPSARVTFEGESGLSGKYYPIASGFIPAAGQRVWMVPIGTTYLIAGGANPSTTQGFYTNGTTNHGVEFGEGSYFDTVEGLQLNTDADVGGTLVVGEDLTVGGRRYVDNEKVLWGSVSATTNTGTTFSTINAGSSMSFTKLYPGSVSRLVVTMKINIMMTAGTVPSAAQVAFLLNGTDYTVDHAVITTLNVHQLLMGVRDVSGLAAGTYTILPRFRNVSASHTVATDGNDYLSLHVREVAA